MDAPAVERWMGLWSRIGAKGNGRPVWSELVERYSEPHRAYHTLEHLGHCLIEWDLAEPTVRDSDEVELAIWFHDSVYDVRANDNELRSAGLADRCLEKAGLPDDLRARVRRLILATQHAAAAETEAAAWLVDVDLAILGQPRDRYARFEKEIRIEYQWVSEVEFRAGRSAVLRRFLDRPSIYATDSFRGRYEAHARDNLLWALDRLN